MDYFLNQFPDRETLLKNPGNPYSGELPKVNNHIHTPFSFSAFSSMADAVEQARREGISILGINDFYVTDGFPEFVDLCLEGGIFPLLNVEMIGVDKPGQAKGIRYNDPGNPGRIYISGKGLSFLPLLTQTQQGKLAGVVRESNKQVAEMIRLLNEWLRRQGTGISLSVEETMERLAENLLRERHVAKMLRIKIGEAAANREEFLRMLTCVYGGTTPQSDPGDVAGTENELRKRLLKAGAPAFVQEDEKAFMPLKELIPLLTSLGGIPTYPMLLDGAGGSLTEFESDKEALAEQLGSSGFYSVEMIPLRNRPEILKEYAGFFYRKGFIVTFGTEHNTSLGGPLTVSCLHNEPLDEELERIGFWGAACMAAHQYLVAREGTDYRKLARSDLEKLGKAVLSYYFNTFIKESQTTNHETG